MIDQQWTGGPLVGAGSPAAGPLTAGIGSSPPPNQIYSFTSKKSACPVSPHSNQGSLTQAHLAELAYCHYGRGDGQMRLHAVFYSDSGNRLWCCFSIEEYVS